jgi:GTP-binding protein LepA
MANGTGNVRNFCIIAHIDHGKSTLADRLLERAGTVAARDMKAQLLDSMDLERERGITIKSHPVRLEFEAADGSEYVFHLIDTPGHVDFHHEVSRSLAACEGALLVVDAAQGVEAQTINNLYLALEHDLEILPVINKIDLPSARPDEITEQVCNLIGCLPDEVVRVSAKTGEGIDQLMEHIVRQIPAPAATRDQPLRAIVFDSIFDAYRGTIAYVRIVDGTVRKGERIRMMGGGQEHEVMETGIFRIQQVKTDILNAGDVGYIATGAKSVSAVQMGDTITTVENPAAEPVIGYVEAKPMVFSGFYPIDADDYVELREALEKLKLNDAALAFEPETSVALGFGFRCGFLGLLHMEIVQERIEREYGVEIIATMPNVEYHSRLRNGTEVVVDNPSRMPDPAELESISEPYVRASIITPKDYMAGAGITALEGERVQLDFLMPLSELVVDFFDKIKSISRGYASLDYDFDAYRESELIKLDILLNGDSVDALSVIVHRDNSYEWGRELCRKLCARTSPRNVTAVTFRASANFWRSRRPEKSV